MKADLFKCPLLLYLMNMFPKGVSEHLIKAKKEILLAMKAMLDAQIEKLEEYEKKEEKAEKIDID